jgi:antitoxin component of RelBE/YafQ-DinJ toxin-antitoxin module
VTEQIREDQSVAALPEQTGLPVASAAAIAAMKVATSGGAPVNIESPSPPKALVVAAKPEQSEIRKQQQAKRETHRRRLAARARLAAQAAQQAALQLNPFLQLAPAARAR